MWLVLTALALGALLPLQVGANAELAGWLGAAIRAAIVNFLVGGVLLAAIAVAFYRGLPEASAFRSVPWWAWLGGLVGAAYVFGSTIVGPRLGAVAFFMFLLAGQSLASLVVDHYGWLGFREHAITPARVGGVALVAAGVALVRLS